MSFAPRPRTKATVHTHCTERTMLARQLTLGLGEAEDADEDNMEEIDPDNIVNTRTRGKEIDYAQAAKDMEDDDEDDEEDDDFEDPDDDKMMED